MLMFDVLKQYGILDNVIGVDAIESGIINRTFFVRTQEGNFVLQLLQEALFKRPNLALSNINLLMDYYERHKQKEKLPYDIHFLESVTGKRNIILRDTYWSCYRLPEDAVMYKQIKNEEMIYNIGETIGQFHHFFKDFPVKKLKTSIPHLNDPVRDCRQLRKYIFKEKKEKTYDLYNETSVPLRHQGKLKLISAMLKKREIPKRVTHNNLRPNNFLFNGVTNSIMAIIGYDAVMPGSWLYDYGEAARYFITETNDLAPAEATINYEYFRAFTKGYLKAVYNDITENEFLNLVDSMKIMALESGLKHLNDYIIDDKLYKVEYKYENLHKAKRQFAFVKELEQNCGKLKRIIENIKNEIAKEAR